MRFLRVALVCFVLSAITALAGQTTPLTQEEKNAFLSRKQWYVSFEFTLHGSGKFGTEKPYSMTAWSKSRRVSGFLELNLAKPGMFPPGAVLSPADMQERGRFTGWMNNPDKKVMDAMFNGETDPSKLPGFYFPIQFRVSEQTNKEWEGAVAESDGSAVSYSNSNSSVQGGGGSYAVGVCMMGADLKNGTYSIAFQLMPTGQGPVLQNEWEYNDGFPTEGTDPVKHRDYLAWPKQEDGKMFVQRSLKGDQQPDGSLDFTVTRPFAESDLGPKAVPMISFHFRLSPTPPSTARFVLRTQGDYSEFRPKPGDSETKPGNSLKIDWEVEEPGVPADKQAKVTKVVFTLAGVSEYPGVCMNWPLNPMSPTDPDLQFKEQVPPVGGYILSDKNRGLTLNGNAVSNRQGTVSVDCFDGAAIGTLTAEATLSDGRVLKGVVEPTGLLKVLIPDREEGVSEIAKAWRNKFAPNLEDAEDREDEPKGDGQVGDGLSVWEEYRGFRQNTIWKDNCDPKNKDIFIENRVGAAAEAGISLFKDATQLVIHKIKEPEHKIDRVINFNSRGDRHTVDQHCLILRVSDDPNVGTAEGVFGAIFPGPPKNTLWVNVTMGHTEDAVYVVGARGGLRSSNFQSKHIAHELSHAIGVYHHGDTDIWTNDKLGVPWESVDIGGGARQLRESGNNITLISEADGSSLGFPIGTEFYCRLGKKNGQHSGDVDCIMRYCVAQAYRYQADSTKRVWHDQIEPPGRTLCTSRLGTDFNKTNQPHPRYFDTDPKRGDCKHQFVISDKWEAKDRN